ncbi:MAG: ABC transporter permease [Armatimonadota bacterium]|jgi:phospholipid/cholesterol/gamma-HCH transport system permease protein
MWIFAPIGRHALALLSFVGGATRLFFGAGWYIVRGRAGLRETLHEMEHEGVSSLLIATVTIVFSSMVFAYYVVEQSTQYFEAGIVGVLLGEAIFRELAPVLTAVVVAARAGSAMTAEIGSMTISEQVDALRALAVDPVQHLVAPRLLASVLMLPVLTIFADYAGLLAGYGAARLQTHEIDAHSFFGAVSMHIPFGIVVRGLAKTVVFGVIIAIVGCHYGLCCERGAAGLGRCVTKCVVVCIILIYITNYFLTRALYPFFSLT